MRNCFISIALLAAAFHGCQSPPATEADEKAVVSTPVQVAPVQFEIISDSISLTASSSYLQNSYVKSTATGFVKAVHIKPGDYVKDGSLLFSLETKESTVIGNSISSLDSNFRFSGMINVRAKGHGFVTALNHQAGDYVQDGEQLAIISDRNSFVFLLNMPYEDRQIVLQHPNVLLTLPDGVRLKGIVGTVFPTVDSATQTQTVTIRVNPATPIPQNLIAQVSILNHLIPHAQLVNAAAVLADDAQSSFWVMKMLDSNTAVKVPITKGMTLGGRIEIRDPVFSATDRLLVSGNYGLGDTAHVTIAKP